MMQKKICMVGPPAVGKTSLVARYVRSLFSERYHSTVGVKIDKKVLQVGDRELALLLWDLAGDDDLQPLKVSYLRGASGYLLVADGTRGATFDQAVELQRRVAKTAGAIPFVLVLNKSDLAGQWDVDDARVAELLAQGWTVRRTSARDGTGVEEAFLELATSMLAAGAGPGGAGSPHE